VCFCLSSKGDYGRYLAESFSEGARREPARASYMAYREGALSLLVFCFSPSCFC